MVQDNKTLQGEAEKNEDDRKEENPLKKPRLDLQQYSELTRVSEYGVFASLTAIYGRVSVPRNLSYLYCGVVEEFCEFKSAARTLEQLQTELGDRDIGTEEGDRDIGTEEGDRDIGAEQGDRDIGTEEGDRDIGTEEGDRDIGAEQGDRDIGAELGDRDIGTEEGDRDIGAEQGDGNIGAGLGDGDIGAEQGDRDIGAEQGDRNIGAELGDGDIGAARLAVLKELGDVTWYLSAMCNELELKLDEVVSDEKVTKDSAPDLAELLDQVLMNVGTIGGKVKKAIRDDQEEMTSEKRGTIERCIRDIFRVIQHDLCPRYSSSILEVMRINAKKAASRFARGVVQGDGDNR